MGKAVFCCIYVTGNIYSEVWAPRVGLGNPTSFFVVFL